MIDGDSPTVRLCAAGMAVDGDPAAARSYFIRAWDAHRDHYEACIAAHFVARHQPTAADTLHWSEVAVAHAEAVPGGRAHPFLASVYLNLADSHLAVGNQAQAAIALERGLSALQYLAEDGYQALVAR